MESKESVLPPILERVRRAPGMYFSPTGFDTIVAFLAGYSSADSGALAGFREWLLVTFNGQSNFAWSALLKKELDRAGVDPVGDEAVEFVMQIVERYWRDTDRHDGLRKIFSDFEEWSRRKTRPQP
jgi:hypothetical protein